MQKTILIYPLIACLVLLNSCSDNDGCSEKEPENITLSQENKNLICYTGLDTLRFLTEQNETILFVAQGKKDYSFTEVFTSGGCKTERNFSGQSIRFLSSKGDKIDMKYDSKSDIKIDAFNNYLGKFHEYFLTIKRPPYDFNNLTINGISYNDVTSFYSDVYDSDSLYYSLKNGIVRIRISSGETFSLIK